MDKAFAQNITLRPYNTFGIDVRASHFISVTSEEELRMALLADHPEKFILGGGSNMLLTKDINALVIHIALKGIRVIESRGHDALVRVAAGENWHGFVQWAIAHDLGGIENLSLIPGNTGTAPIQNIGAYGVELKDVFHSCEAMDTATGAMRTFTLEECAFGYRDSVFKNDLKGKYVITSVTFRLTATDHTLHTGYGAISAELEKMGVSQPRIGDISRAVIAIRQSKLPDPANLGNSGSFFKNPVIGESAFKTLLEAFPKIPHYPAGQGRVKVPAGWLIEQCGLKGYRQGDAGVHRNQALVLVNYGNATGEEIYNLSRFIQQQVLEKFGIAIEAEVNII